MIAVGTSLHAALRNDFLLACVDLTEALARYADEETGACRDAVIEARARVDAVLDMHLEASAHRAGPV
jgi:hypothetical protein